MERVQLTVENLLDLDIVDDAQIAPGGERIAYTIAENGARKGEKTPQSRIWLHYMQENRSFQASAGPGTDRQPRWSPDGRRLTFLSDREKRGTSQVYLVDDSPRDAWKLTGLPSGVTNHQWSNAGDALAVVANDHTPEDEENDVKLFDSDGRFRRLYRCDIESGETTPIEHGDLHVWEFCWSPDDRLIAAIASEAPYEWGWYSAGLVLIDSLAGTCRTLHTPERQIARPVWSPDGSTIALISCRWSDPGMTGGDVLLVDVETGTVHNITAGAERSHLTVHWLPGSDELVSMAWERARAQFCRVSLTGAIESLWTEEAGINDYGCTFDPDSGKVASVLSRGNEPPEVWTSAGRYDDQSLVLTPATATNSDLPFAPFGTKWLSWQSTDGLTIEGLYLSPDHRSSNNAPAMATLVHGGPTGVATASFPTGGTTGWIPFLLQAGIAVFMPNFRGSNGYGVEFAEANMGDLGGLDLQDVLTGVDECVRMGLADGSSLGIGGWSYGGYMTALAITQTHRFSAAVAGASITNWFSFHGGTNIPGFDNQYIGAPPDELDGPYAWTSPLFSCKTVSTPTLFLHGEQDPVCPVGQAYEMTRSLRRRGVDVECAVYPREGHGFVEREHRRDMTERAVGWFTRYLGGS